MIFADLWRKITNYDEKMTKRRFDDEIIPAIIKALDQEPEVGYQEFLSVLDTLNIPEKKLERAGTSEVRKKNVLAAIDLYKRSPRYDMNVLTQAYAYFKNEGV